MSYHERRKLILILARAGTKNISRQNIRLVNDKPLIYYVINASLQIKSADVFVSTDSEEIKQMSLLYGVNVICRPKSLTKDSTSTEDTAYHALSYLDPKNLVYEKCLIINPHFPLIKPSTINRFFSLLNKQIQTIFGFEKQDASEYCTIKDNKTNEKITELNLFESNIVQRKKIVSFNCEKFLKYKKFQKPEYGIQLDDYEIFSPRSYHDFGVLEKIINRKRILVRLHGSKTIGLGHVYNMLTILNQFRNEEILVMMNVKNSLGSKKMEENLYNIRLFSNETEFFDIMSRFKPDIIFNDILNTEENYIKKLKKQNLFIVNFEDLGNGRKFADLVFNPIFDSKKRFKNEYYGSNYACVRDEFRIFSRKDLRKVVKKIVITLGGVDYNNNTYRILEIIKKSNILMDVVIDVILGFSFAHQSKLMTLVNDMRQMGYQIFVIEQTNLLSKYIVDADFVITSNGRTVFEVASLKIPIISISVNSREKQHNFVKKSHVGFHVDFNNKSAAKNLIKCVDAMLDYKIRLKLIKNLDRINLRKGISRVVRIIMSEYEKTINV